MCYSDQREAGAADGEEEGDDVQVGQQMGLAQTPWVQKHSDSGNTGKFTVLI